MTLLRKNIQVDHNFKSWTCWSGRLTREPQALWSALPLPLSLLLAPFPSSCTYLCPVSRKQLHLAAGPIHILFPPLGTLSSCLYLLNFYSFVRSVITSSGKPSLTSPTDPDSANPDKLLCCNTSQLSWRNFCNIFLQLFILLLLLLFSH